MKVVVAIPWRPTPDRVRAFEFVCDWYRGMFPDWPVVVASSPHVPFSRAGSRNACVREAARHGADVVVINDADTIPDPATLLEAVAAAVDGRLHFGLDRMAYLTAEQTAELYRGGTPDGVDARPHDSSVVVITPAAYWHAGGQDERFTGYGGEDNAFTAACTALLGRPVWHRGVALSLYHDPACRDIGSARWRRDTSPLHRRYQAARRSPTRMRRLIAERER